MQWKEEGIVTRCTIISISSNMGIGRMDTYLETISTAVSWNWRNPF